MKGLSTETEFLIVGAGPAGLILGIELLRQKRKVKILERHPHQMRAVCGEYLSPEGKDLLQELDLGFTLDGFQSVHGMILYSPGGKQVTTHFPLEKKGISLNREIFQRRLEQAFQKLGGEIGYGETVTDGAVTAEGIRINHHHASWLIGADGRQSAVARIFSLKAEPHTEKRVALHCYLRPHSPLGQLGQMHILLDGSYVGINPISETEVNFSLVTDQSHLKDAGGPKELLNFWIHHQSDLRRQFPLITSEQVKSSYPIRRQSLEIVKGPVALIGDASGFIDPLTGEGITTAIKTARLLAGEISRRPSVQEAFAYYELGRRRDFAEKERLNYFFQKLIKYPGACDAVALGLLASKEVRDTFIGAVGNIYSPSEALKMIFKGYFTARY